MIHWGDFSSTFSIWSRILYKMHYKSYNMVIALQMACFVTEMFYSISQNLKNIEVCSKNIFCFFFKYLSCKSVARFLACGPILDFCVFWHKMQCYDWLMGVILVPLRPGSSFLDYWCIVLRITQLYTEFPLKQKNTQNR